MLSSVPYNPADSNYSQIDDHSPDSYDVLVCTSPYLPMYWSSSEHERVLLSAAGAAGASRAAALSEQSICHRE